MCFRTIQKDLMRQNFDILPIRSVNEQMNDISVQGQT